jgi:cytochrome c556
MRNRRLWLLAGLLGLADSTLVSGQPSADQIIQNRIANFREIGTADKIIRDELNSTQPNPQRIRQSAQLISNRGADMLHWFPPGSEPEAQASKSWLDTILGWFSSDDSLPLVGETKSHAKHSIWAQRQAFEQAYSKFKAEADRMSLDAQKGQPSSMAAQHAALGKTCKGCHDVYREKLN